MAAAVIPASPASPAGASDGGALQPAGRPMEWSLKDQTASRTEKLRKLHNNPKYSDVTLQAQLDPKGSFFGYRAILAIWSPVFESLLFPPLTDAPPARLAQTSSSELPLEVDGTTLEIFLDYVHGGTITVTLMNLWPLYCFLNTYQVQDLIDKVEDILEQAVSVHTCCSLLASAQQHGTYDHYALRKCLNLLLMDFQEVTRTPGFLTLEYDVLEAVIASDELNAPEEVIFDAVMRWIAADEVRPQAHLDDLLERIRFPLLDPKFVSSLDAHPLASRSARLPKLMLTALKFAVNPADVVTAGRDMFRPRKGGLYWTATKNNVCMDLAHDQYRTFVCSASCDLVRQWRLQVDAFEEGSVVVGVAEAGVDPDQYVGRFTEGWGLADNGHFYHGACKCPPSMRALCTPLCTAHVTLEPHCVVDLELHPAQGLGSDLVIRSGGKEFRHRLQLREGARLFPAVSVRRAKVKIFADEGELFDEPR